MADAIRGKTALVTGSAQGLGREIALALAAAQAALAALASLGVPSLSIKPPNDVLADGKKICGILLEPRLAPSGDVDFLVAGFGINALHVLSDFPPALRATATSCALLGVPLAPPDLLPPLSSFWRSALAPYA